MATTALKARKLLNSLTVNDLPRSTRLYMEGLGFALQQEYKMEEQVVGVMLESGEAALMLTQDDFAKGKDRPKGGAMRMYLETEQDLAALAAQARTAGLTVHGDPAPLGWGPRGFSVTDPDGFNLTIAEPMPQ
jgi:uncharacterized glyoxalase superfamily protein PhnB